MHVYWTPCRTTLEPLAPIESPLACLPRDLAVPLGVRVRVVSWSGGAVPLGSWRRGADALLSTPSGVTADRQGTATLILNMEVVMEHGPNATDLYKQGLFHFRVSQSKCNIV